MKLRNIILLSITLSIITSLVSAGEINLDQNGIAISGYDPVAYFGDSKATMGKQELTFLYKQAIYQFANTDNRERFIQNPEKYLPAYGGYCAWAMSKGYIAPIDPNAWTVHDGRLFLNYSNSYKRRFNRNIEKNIKKADENWPSLKSRA